MKISGILVGALVLTLPACDSAPTKAEGGASAASMSTIPISVAIVGGNIKVADDTYTYPNHNVLQWTIVTPGNYTFPDNGIVFQHPGNFACAPHQGGGTTFVCKKLRHQIGKHKYEVNVNDGAKPLPFLDPFIHNQ